MGKIWILLIVIWLSIHSGKGKLSVNLPIEILICISHTLVPCGVSE
jgi:hypothetical protein